MLHHWDPLGGKNIIKINKVFLFFVLLVSEWVSEWVSDRVSEWTTRLIELLALHRGNIGTCLCKLNLQRKKILSEKEKKKWVLWKRSVYWTNHPPQFWIVIAKTQSRSSLAWMIVQTWGESEHIFGRKFWKNTEPKKACMEFNFRVVSFMSFFVSNFPYK